MKLKYYAHIKDNEIFELSNVQHLDEGITNVEVSKEVFMNPEKFRWNGSKVVQKRNLKARK